ncbi:MAG: endonuclease III [Candidatus Aenigmarchaeota archaeon]|nr:endonuclease III [Candidatus Aenigmarchaeota archaeon]
MKIISVIKILKKNRRKFVTPALTEIAERTSDPYKVLISCLLSLRTKDETTARASEQLYRIAETPKQMMNADIKKIKNAIYSVNYYKTKAMRIKQISEELVKNYNGRVPDDIDELMKFKGVGRKTANIVLVYGFHKHGMPVDTHVHRVSNRLGWVQTKTPEKTEMALRTIVPKKYWMDINDLLVQFGQNVCRPVGPKCNECPVFKYCNYYKKVYLKKTS